MPSHTQSGGKDLLMLSWESRSLSHSISATFSVSVSPCVTLTPINSPNLSLSSLTEHIWGFLYFHSPRGHFQGLLFTSLNALTPLSLVAHANINQCNQLKIFQQHLVTYEQCTAQAFMLINQLVALLMIKRKRLSGDCALSLHTDGLHDLK